MSEPFETAGRDRIFTDSRPPLADIFGARPAAPRRGKGDAEPNRQQRPENDAASRKNGSAANGATAPRLQALRGAASRARSNRRTTDERLRVAGLAGGGDGGRLAGRRLPALERTLIGGALLSVVIAAVGLVVGRQSPPRKPQERQTQAPPQAVKPRGVAAGLPARSSGIRGAAGRSRSGRGRPTPAPAAEPGSKRSVVGSRAPSRPGRASRPPHRPRLINRSPPRPRRASRSRSRQRLYLRPWRLRRRPGRRGPLPPPGGHRCSRRRCPRAPHPSSSDRRRP
jgi:hypothetical protein